MSSSPSKSKERQLQSGNDSEEFLKVTGTSKFTYVWNALTPDAPVQKKSEKELTVSHLGKTYIFRSEGNKPQRRKTVDSFLADQNPRTPSRNGTQVKSNERSAAATSNLKLQGTFGPLPMRKTSSSIGARKFSASDRTDPKEMRARRLKPPNKRHPHAHHRHHHHSRLPAKNKPSSLGQAEKEKPIGGTPTSQRTEPFNSLHCSPALPQQSPWKRTQSASGFGTLMESRKESGSQSEAKPATMALTPSDDSNESNFQLCSVKQVKQIAVIFFVAMVFYFVCALLRRPNSVDFPDSMDFEAEGRLITVRHYKY